MVCFFLIAIIHNNETIFVILFSMKLQTEEGRLYMTIIHVEDVSWRRNGKHILRDINWKVNEGEHWAILGLNGSGKTTLLNMLNGYIWPTTGKVTVLNEPFGQTDIRALRKRIGWVSSSLQERILATQKVEQIVISGKFGSTGLYDERSHLDEEKAYTLLEKLQCAHLQGKEYGVCSQGEQQKVLIARALMADPELLILDEPTNGLDFIAREKLLDAISQLTEEANSPTLLFVTHHVDEISPLFTHALLMKNGTVFSKGTRNEMFQSTSMSTFFDKNVTVEWKFNRPSLTIPE